MNKEEISPYQSDQAPQESALNLKSIIRSLLVRWYWLLLGGLLGLGWGYYQSWKAVPLYQSQSTVLVRDYSVSVLKTVDAAEFDVRSAAALETIRAGLLNYELCERVASDPKVRALKGIVPPPPKKLFQPEGDQSATPAEVPPSPVLAGMIRSWLTVNLQEDSRLMSIVVKHPEPIVAATIANVIVDEYVEQRAEVKKTGKTENFELLTAQSTRLTKELSESRAKLAIYDTPNRAELALVSAEQEFNAVTLRYRQKHPQYIEAKRKVDQVKAQLRESLERVVVNPTDKEYWNDHSHLIEDLDEDGGFDKLREKLIERRAQLETEIESQSKIAETISTQLEATEINKAQNEAEVVPYEKARISKTPVTEGKTTLITKNALFGLVGGIALAILFQLLDNKFHTVDDLERQASPLPVLAAIPRIDGKVLKKLKGEILPGREKWAPTLIFGREDTETVIAESVRVLRAAISLLGPTEDRKTTLVTSALPSEGKTTVASNLACAMAQEGKKVALVDLDLRKPSLHKGFGLHKGNTKGVVDVLIGRAGLSETLVADTGAANLHLMLSGPKAPNPGELLNSSRLKEFIGQLRDQYDHVVIDSAPVLAVADSRLIAPLVDNFVFVVRASSTPKGALKRALEVLESDGTEPSGLVLNDFQESRIMAGNNYRYGYYRGGQYTYGSYGSED